MMIVLRSTEFIMVSLVVRIKQ